MKPGEALAALDAEGLRRTLQPLDSPTGARVVRDGRELWNFASNDYLGLANDAAVRAAFHEGLERWGHGAAASRLITGSQPPHVALESALAAAKGAEAALTFSSGFAAALGAIPALVGAGDHVLVDKLCHACLIDGARLSGAKLRVFPHHDTARLRRLLEGIRARDAGGRVLILAESVYSMDGDLAPLAELVALKDEFGARLLLDEAHGFGVLGASGMGLAEELGLQSRIDFQMGTLSKAAGLAGAYLVADRDWIELLVNRARSFIYTTAPPPALAHAAVAALELIRSPEGARRRATLADHARRLRPEGPPTPIVPVILGDNDAALAAHAALLEAGLLVPAIRFPTVPRNSARLRVSLSASHPPAAVAALADALASLAALG